MKKEEKEKITLVDVEKWPLAIVVFSEDDPYQIIHGVMYEKLPSNESLIDLKREIIEDFGYKGDPNKLKYVVVSSEEFLELIGVEKKDK